MNYFKRFTYDTQTLFTSAHEILYRYNNQVIDFVHGVGFFEDPCTLFAKTAHSIIASRENGF